MNKLFKAFLIVCVVLLSAQISNSQDLKTFNNANFQKVLLSGMSNTFAGNIKHSYDVLNYKLQLNVYDCFKSPFPKSFSAYELITLRVDSVINSIKLNAINNSLFVDSVRLLNYSLLNISHSSNILSVVLNRYYNPGEIVDLEIYYRHKNIYDSAFHVNNGLVYTDCEHQGARKWFPCWDKPSDKATTDITVKVPSNVLLGSNGLLRDSIRSGDTIYYHWVSRDPMSTYLITIAGSTDYNLEIRYWPKLSNPLDSIPIRYYPKPGETYTNVRDSMNILVDFYSSRFGEYPFEKIGFASSDMQANGCMENQTLITMVPGTWVLWGAGHEFSHHWFGDLITCGTWADVWLNEGFATYCEALWYEHLLGVNEYKNAMDLKAQSYFTGNNGRPIYNPEWIDNEPPNLWTLLYYPLMYAKGSCVLYMLRNVLGDSVFFDVIHSYVTDTNFTFKNAVTDDFTAKINQVTGQDYSWFINEWVKQPNHPVYQNNVFFINLGGGNWRVNFVAKQIQLNTPFHKMPVEIKVHFTDSTDTLLNVFNNTNNQSFTFDFNKQPDSLKFDPDDKIILKQGTTTIGITMISDVIPERFSLSQNYPNPFNPVTKIKFSIPKSSQVKIVIFDLLGKEIETIVDQQLNPGEYENDFDGSRLSSGVYFYMLIADDITETKKMLMIK
ncbi:MAG: T9SS type A sorting domain-containing protein [Ignavibacteria bacterium]|nr:T9SS type A sorting domain-containing protein [Ignavibacteria bacterium]